MRLEEPLSLPPVASPSLRFNFSWTFLGYVVYSLCQWGMVSVLAKAGGVATVGQFALALAVSTPIFMFTNLQLRAVQATDVRSDYRFSDYVGLRVVATLAGFAAAGLVVAIARFDRTAWEVIMLVSLAKGFECLSDVVAGLLQKEERLDRVAISLIVRGLLSVLVFSVLFLRFQNLVLAVVGMAFVWGAVLAVLDLRWARDLLPPGEPFLRIHWSQIKRLFVLSAPLGVVISLASLSLNIPRYFVQHYRGPADLGIFASLAYILFAVNLVVNALGQAATTRLSRMFAAGEVESFRRLVWTLAAVGVAITLIGVPASWLLGRQILTLLYRREYADHVGLFALIVAGGGINAIGAFVVCGVSAARSFRAQVPVNLLSTATVIVSCMILVPMYGLYGAAMAFLLSSIVAVIGDIAALQLATSAVSASQ